MVDILNVATLFITITLLLAADQPLTCVGPRTTVQMETSYLCLFKSYKSSSQTNIKSNMFYMPTMTTVRMYLSFVL